MINITDKSQCTGCTACYSICGHNAITMQFDECSHIYPIVDMDKCTDCGLCEKVCPLLHKDSLPQDVNLEELQVKAVYNKNDEVRSRSTSGGLFSLLADYIIDKGGIVCAARFDEKYHIFHDFFNSMDDVDPFRGSKYAQSDLGHVFCEIKSYLKLRPVLFIGTPCQVAGLKKFLIKECDNLYTCDFICMSISSGKMWDEYMADYQSSHSVKRVFFKDKRIGWHRSDWRMLIRDERGDQLCRGGENPYFFAYLKHYSARPSCFDCAVRHCRHMSDFTIADCWGIESVAPEFDDNKGCTALILQSEKAHAVFDAIKDNANVIDFDLQNVRKYNRHIEQQAFKPNSYIEFYSYYKLYGFTKAAKKMMRNELRKTLFCRIISKLKSITK